ncbi:MAG: DUF3098 domain-containing protein [Bacteroidota bacterium]|nr:DUF3098 domain-containing protein [Bacteroidota bacterium]MDX5429721.1 DUF3098 domain-containing protein [Bacteroidota bacterium]MDX5468502.1 DUF3098 domain-containing protein [Bacteroidota bacterium]
MSKNNAQQAAKKEDKAGNALLFGRENYLLMLLSVVFIVIGFTLMSGTEDIFSTTKITVAPITVLLGFVIGVFSIFYKKK